MGCQLETAALLCWGKKPHTQQALTSLKISQKQDFGS